jgi:hypothetical protein
MTSISFIKHLKQVTPAEREDELTKKISASRDIIAKLLELVKNADKNNKDLVQQLNEGNTMNVGFQKSLQIRNVLYEHAILYDDDSNSI